MPTSLVDRAALPPKSLPGLNYLQVMEAAHIQAQLRAASALLVADSIITHKCHQASHAGPYNGYFCRLSQCQAHMLDNTNNRTYFLLLLL